MGLAFKILRYSPTNNPDTAEIGVTATGNYVTAVGGSAADLSPGNISDPNGVGLLGEPSNQPSTPPSIEAESLDGYYAELIPAAAGAALSGNKIRFWVSEGVELGSGAFPAAILNGTLTIRLPLR